MANASIEDQLFHIKQIINSSAKSECSELEAILGKKVSEELCAVLVHSRKLNKIKLPDEDGYFWGHDFISYNDLIGQYKDKAEKYTFFGQWGVDDRFNVKGALRDGHNFSLEYDFNGELEQPLEITNVRSLVPILFFEGEFILFSTGSGGLPEGLMSVSSDGFSSMIAPSISEHIDDLILGIQTGIYRVEEDGVIFPHNWFDRVRLKHGEIKMDEYGGIIEPDT